MDNFKEYITGKMFYTYGEDTEIFFSKGSEELYNNFLSECEDIEDFPVEMVDYEDFIHKKIVSDARYSDGDILNEDGTYTTTVLKILQTASKNSWETPWQLSSSYN